MESERDEAVKLLREFEAYASEDPDYEGSPFEQRVSTFLETHGSGLD
jgi:hypothetical protein